MIWCDDLELECVDCVSQQDQLLAAQFPQEAAGQTTVVLTGSTSEED